jgi:Mg-chelatase subunit ChlD
MGITVTACHRTLAALVIVFLTHLWIPGVSQALDTSSFRISQAISEAPDISAYLEVLDDRGNQAQGLQKQQLTATLGANPITITDVKSWQDVSEGIAYILLVDVSRSLKDAEFTQVRKVLTDWIEAMGPKDQAAIITFGTQVKTVLDFTGNTEALKAKVAGLKPVDDQTQLHLGLVKALELGRRVDAKLPKRRAIMTLSDGQDDFAGGLTKQEVLDKIKVDPVPIYAIGFYSPPKHPAKEEFLKNLGEFARSSGGTYVRAGSGNFQEMYNKIHQRLTAVYVARLACPNCQWNGAVQHLQMDLTSGTTAMRAGLELRLTPKMAAPAPVAASAPEAKSRLQQILDYLPPLRVFGKTIPGYVYAGAGLLLLLLLALGIVLQRRRRHLQARQDDTIPERPDGEFQPAPANFNTFGGTMEMTGAIPDSAPVFGAAHSSSPAGMKIRLTVLRGGNSGTQPFDLVLQDSLIIGRSQGQCDVLLENDREVSRQHCQLNLENGAIRLIDLESKNGTFVNGVPITGPYRLKQDDILMVGKTELRLTILGE